jgi:hypothetical protein
VVKEHDGLGEPRRHKAWAGVTLFFGVGVAIALTVTYGLLHRGSSVACAVPSGACAGGFGAWFVFYVVLNTMKWGQRRGK